MTVIDVSGLDHKTINESLRRADGECALLHCCGQRFIAAGMSDKKITIEGIPGNALGAYLNGASIVVNSNAQDQTGDTMNEGVIVIHGDVGDAAGYAMRGGRIFVRGNAGYRAGIHMKAYGAKSPAVVIGGRAGSFLGEYQAGGVIVVLGLGSDGQALVGDFPCTGMHGGKLYLRTDRLTVPFPNQVTARPASDEELAELRKLLTDYCGQFGLALDEVMNAPFTVVTPDSQNPYRRMYVAN